MSYQQNVLIAYKENVSGNEDNNFNKVKNYLDNSNTGTSTLINNPLPTSGNLVGNLCDNVTTFYRNRQALFLKHVDGQNVGNVESYTLNLINANTNVTDNKLYLVDANTVAYSTQYLQVVSTNELTQYDGTNPEDSEYKIQFQNSDNSFKQRTVNHSRNTDNNLDGMKVGYDNVFNVDALYSEKQLVLEDSATNKYGWTDLPQENRLSTYYDVNYVDNEGDANISYGVYKFVQVSDEQKIDVTITKDDSEHDILLANTEVPFATSGDFDKIGQVFPSYFFGVSGEYLDVNSNNIALNFCVNANVSNDGQYTLEGENSSNNFLFNYDNLQNSLQYYSSGAVKSNIELVVSSGSFTRTSEDDLENMQLVQNVPETISDPSKIDNTFEVEVDSTTNARLRFLDSECGLLDSNNYSQTFSNLDLTLNNSLTARVYYENDSDVQNNFYLQGADLTNEVSKHTFTYVAAETTEPSRDDNNRLPSFRHLNNDHELHYSITKNNNLTFSANSSNMDAFIVDIKSTAVLANERILYGEDGLPVGTAPYDEFGNLIDAGLDNDLLLASVTGENLDNADGYKDNRLRLLTKTFDEFTVKFDRETLDNFQSNNVQFYLDTRVDESNEILYKNAYTGLIYWPDFVNVYYNTSTTVDQSSIRYKHFWPMEDANESVLFDGLPNKIEIEHRYDDTVPNQPNPNAGILTIQKADIFPSANVVSKDDAVVVAQRNTTINNNTLTPASGTRLSSQFSDVRLVYYKHTFNRRISYNTNIPGVKNVGVSVDNIRDIITQYRIQYLRISDNTWVEQGFAVVSQWRLNGQVIHHSRVLSVQEDVDSVTDFTNKNVAGVNFDTLMENGNYIHKFRYNFYSFSSMKLYRQYKDNSNNWVDVVRPFVEIIDYRDYGLAIPFEDGKLTVKFYSGEDLVLQGGKNYYIDLTLDEESEDTMFTTVKLYDFTNNLDKYPRDLYNANLESLGVPSRDLVIDLRVGPEYTVPWNSSEQRSLRFLVTDPNEEFDANILSEVYFLTNMRINYVKRPIVTWDGEYRLLYKNTDSFVEKNMNTPGFNLYYTVNQDYFNSFNNNNSLSSQDFVLDLVPDSIRVKYYDGSYSSANLEPIYKLTYNDNSETHYITLNYYRGYQTRHVIFNRSTTSITASVFGTLDENTYTQEYTNVYNGKVLVLDNLRDESNQLIDLGLEVTSLFSMLKEADNTQYRIVLTPSTVTYNITNPLGSMDGFVPSGSEFVTNLRDINSSDEGSSYTLTKALRLLPRRAVSLNSYNIEWCFVESNINVYFSPFNDTNYQNYSQDVSTRTYNSLTDISPSSLINNSYLVNNVFSLQKSVQKVTAGRDITAYVTCIPPQYYVDMIKFNSQVPSNSSNTVRYYNFVRKSYVYNHQTYNVGNTDFFGVNARGNGVDQTAEPLLQFTKLNFSQDSRYLRYNFKDEVPVNMLENRVMVTAYANQNLTNGVVVFDGYLDRQFEEDTTNTTTTNYMHPDYPVIRQNNFDYVLRFKQILSEIVSSNGVNGGTTGITDNNDIYNIELLFNNVSVPQGTYNFDLAPEKSVRPYFFYKQFNNVYRITCNDFDVETALPRSSSCGYLRFVINLVEKLSGSSWVEVEETDILYSLYNLNQSHLQIQFNYNTIDARNRLLSTILPTQHTNKLLLLNANDIMKWVDASGNELFVVSYAGHVHTQYVHNVATKFYSLGNDSKYTEGLACENILLNMPSYVIEQ